jgi:predicted nucleotidyltransferase
VSTLGDRLLAIDAALTDGGIDHAFGGAIALAYCTQEPRGTRDVDVNLFVGPEQADRVLGALPADVTITKQDRATAKRDGQVRVRWDETPIDLFFNMHEFHSEVADSVVEVPFQGVRIPVLGCEALLVFKAMFNRTRDWADIEAMIAGGGVDGPACLARVRSLLGPSDPAAVRLAGLLG